MNGGGRFFKMDFNWNFIYGKRYALDIVYDYKMSSDGQFLYICMNSQIV